jgi:hypothetical protein
MNNYAPQPGTKVGFFRRFFPATALHKRSDSDLFKSDPSMGSTEYHKGTLTDQLVKAFHVCWPWSRRAEVFAQLRVCQDQIRNLSVAHAEITRELTKTQEALSGYVRQCSVRCPNFEYVPGDVPDEHPALQEGDPNDSSILPSEVSDVGTAPTNKNSRSEPGTAPYLYHG